MGLDCSHDAWNGAYSAFNQFRQCVAKAIGGSFPPHDDPKLDSESWYAGEGYTRSTHPGLFIFLSHSDCDGEISPIQCSVVADDLEEILPKIAEVADSVPHGGFTMKRTEDPDVFSVNRTPGHIGRGGGFVEVTRRFIRGCRRAAEAGEPLEFR